MQSGTEKIIHNCQFHKASLTPDNHSLESAGLEPAPPEAPLADSPPAGDGAVLLNDKESVT